MPDPVWTATNGVAAELCKSPVVQQLSGALANWRFESSNDPASAWLQDCRSNSVLENRPLTLGLVIPFQDDLDKLHETQAGKDWYAAAVSTTDGFIRLVEWIRSRLPRYPSIPVPHLQPDSPWSGPGAFYFGVGAPWVPELRLEQPQFRNAPDLSPFGLSDRGKALGSATQVLLTALKATTQWGAFDEASAALTKADLQKLKAINKGFRKAVSDDVVDKVEPDLMIRIRDYKEAVLTEVVDSATGRVSTYIDAFEQLDALISAVVRVIERCVVFGPPQKIGDAVEGTWRRAPYGRRVRVVGNWGPVIGIRPGLLELESEIESLAGVMLGERMSASIAFQFSSGQASQEGLLLPASAGTLHAGPAWS